MEEYEGNLMISHNVAAPQPPRAIHDPILSRKFQRRFMLRWNSRPLIGWKWSCDFYQPTRMLKFQRSVNLRWDFLCRIGSMFNKSMPSELRKLIRSVKKFSGPRFFFLQNKERKVLIKFVNWKETLIFVRFDFFNKSRYSFFRCYLFCWRIFLSFCLNRLSPQSKRGPEPKL